MPKFVIDEDIPRSTGRILKQRGYDVRDIRVAGRWWVTIKTIVLPPPLLLNSQIAPNFAL